MAPVKAEAPAASAAPMPFKTKRLFDASCTSPVVPFQPLSSKLHAMPGLCTGS